MKIICRFIVLSAILLPIMGKILGPITISPSETELDTKQWLLYIWLISSLMGTLFFWIYMLYHWGVTEFNSSAMKLFWLLILVFGIAIYFIGPFVYYVAVFELGKGIKRLNE